MSVNELLDLLCEALDIESGSLTPDTRIEGVAEWNSLGWLTIMSLTDERLNVQISSKDIRTFKTVQDVINYIGSKTELVK